MISLCNDTFTVTEALETQTGCDCLKEIIKLYLESYGTEYDFNQFYVQYNDNRIPTAVLHRYNTKLHLICVDADFEELLPFVCGFYDTELITNADLSSYLTSYVDCLVMSKKGEESDVLSSYICDYTDAKAVAELVCKKDSAEIKTDFFLNTALQLRRGKLIIEACLVNDRLASVASATNLSEDLSVLTFVYTDEYFRGNGYMKKLLFRMCSSPEKKYMLLCEKHNVKFYEKCGFTQQQKLYKFSL